VLIGSLEFSFDTVAFEGVASWHCKFLEIALPVSRNWHERYFAAAAIA